MVLLAGGGETAHVYDRFARFSARVGGLVYLDAAWDRTYVPPVDSDRSADFDRVGIPGEPKADPTRFDPRDAIRAGVERPAYGSISTPALGLDAAPRMGKELMPGVPEFADREKQSAAERVVSHFERTRTHMEEMFRSGVRGSRVIEIPGASHYIFRTNEADVLREIRSFLDSLDR